MSENKCQYMVTGMTCAACQAHVEKAVSKVPGVDSVTVSLLTNSMSVAGNAPAAAVVKAVDEEFGGIDILVNNAAIFDMAPINGITEESYERVFDINLKGPSS